MQLEIRRERESTEEKYKRREERTHTGQVPDRYFTNERDQGRRQVSGIWPSIFGQSFLISHNVLWKEFPCVLTKH